MPPSPAAAPPARPRILLVEDDDAVRRSLQLLLLSQGYDVRAYRTGHGLAGDPEALKSGCLIADLIMPESDALELLHDLRGAGWRGPSILISGHLTDEWAAQAKAAGYDAVLPKPIGETVLVGWIARLLASAKQA
jgi:FixJ family two-component response regulator